MGKDKKERNPADQFRKEQRKKELLKLKKDRAVVRDVREMLNDPRKIDAEIAKVQKQSDENKLDKTLKDRIKELQRMKDVANTRQLVLAAQGKISQDELANITKPSIYQSNDGVWDDPKSAKTNAHPHVKSASRISTEGLPVYTRGGDQQAAVAQLPVPASVMLPYPPALTPNIQAYPRGLPARGVPNLAVGGMGGIPLPPPRPQVQQAVAGMVPPPPPPLPGFVPPPRGAAHPGGFPPPPPPPPIAAGVPGGGAVAAPQAHSAYPAPYPVAPMGYPPMHPVYATPYYPAPPPVGAVGYGPPYAGHHPGMHPQMYGAPRPGSGQTAKPPKVRPPRERRQQPGEVDPLDPAGEGYTERFGSAPPKRSAAIPAVQQDGTSPAQGSTALPSQAFVRSEATVEAPARDDKEEGDDDDGEGDSSEYSGSESEDEKSQNTKLPPADTVQHSTQPPAQYFGTVLTAEELMRRRTMVTEDAAPSVPAPPPPGSFGTTLSAEELLRRRHTVLEPAAATAETSNDTVGPAGPGPSLPPPPHSYGVALSAEELLRRRYMIPDSEELEVGNASGVRDSSPSGAPAGPSFPSAEPLQANSGAEDAVDAEELMRQKYYIPDMEAEDVNSDEEDEYEDAYPGGGEGEREDDGSPVASDDEVRSAGEAAPFDSAEYPPEVLDEEDEGGFVLPELVPARLPASFVQLPVPRVPGPPPVSVPPPAATKSSAVKASALAFDDYGDDDEEEGDYEQEVPVQPSAPKVTPFAPYVPTSLPAYTPVTTSASSSRNGGAAGGGDVEENAISRAIVKGPKIIKPDRALTAFVPNALKKKRPLQPLSTATKAINNKTADATDGGKDSDGEERQTSKAPRRSEMDAESLHAATSALLRPTAAAALGDQRSGFTLNRDASAALTAPSKPALAPIAFVPARAVTSTVPAHNPPVKAVAAEDDAFAQFFDEIHQLEGSG